MHDHESFSSLKHVYHLSTAKQGLPEFDLQHRASLYDTSGTFECFKWHRRIQ